MISYILTIASSTLGKFVKDKTLTTALISGIVVQVVWAGVFYGERLFRLNQYVFTIDGDGLKSYFNITYQAKHASESTSLQGMSYPYGESVFLEDSMPWLNIALQKLSRIFPAVSNYTVGIINLFYFVSLLAATLFLVLIFNRYGISGIACGVLSNGVVMLSSVHLLLWPYGHLGLAQPAFLPMGIYFLIRFFTSGGAAKWSVAIVLNTIFWSFIHVYLGLILLFLGLGTHLIYLVLKPNFYSGWKRAFIQILLQIGVPLFTFFLFLKLFDTHPNRIDFPFIEDHRTTLSSLLLPAESPLRNWIISITEFQPDPAFRWQRIGSYLGIVTLLVLVLMLITTALGQRDIWRYFSKQHHFELSALWISAWLVLMYSMAFPFRFLPEEWLTQIPYLKQFSSFGRFAWAFYFATVIFALVWVHQFVKEKFASKTVLVAGLFFLVEAVPIHQKVSAQGLRYPNPFLSQMTNSEYFIFQQINPKEYQTIIPLPTYFKYAIPIDKPGTDSVIFASIIAAVHSGVPIMSTFLSRPSVTESLDIYRALQTPPYRIPLEKMANDARDFALLFHMGDTVWFDINERKLLAQSFPVAQNSRFCIYRLPKDSLLSNRLDTLWIDNISDTLYTIPQGNKVIWESWNNMNSPVSYRGRGAFFGTKNIWNTLIRIPVAELSSADEFEISFWYYNHQWDQTFNTIFLSETNPSGETVQWLNLFEDGCQTIDGWWYFYKKNFRVYSPDNTINIVSLGQNKFLPWFAVDELLIRPTGVDVFRITEQNEERFLLKNNLLFRVAAEAK